MTVTVSSALIARIVTEAEAASPSECCGLLLGTGRTVTAVRPAANVHPVPDRFFEIDPRALIAAHRAAREGGAALLGYYHSHPAGPAIPSATDRALAALDGRLWAIAGRDAAGAWQVGWWQAAPTGFEPLSLASSPV